MELTKKLKERFTEDNRIPIKLYWAPYFIERLNLYDRYFNTIPKWEEFLKTLEKFPNDEAYLGEYNRIKDAAITMIRSSEDFNRFNTKEDANKWAVKNRNISSKDEYKPSNIGRTYISIDMKKANFSCLRHYSPNIFDGAKTWEDFVMKFTDCEYLAKSKYIRQVIIGNCNCGKHITYEKYLTDQLLTMLTTPRVFTEDSDPIPAFTIDRVVSFSNDEIVIDVTDLVDEKLGVNNYNIIELQTNITTVRSMFPIPTRMELFTIRGIMDSRLPAPIGYIREMTNGSKDFKCLNSLSYPLVLRTLNNEPIKESDMIFEHEKMLARFIEIPTITIV